MSTPPVSARITGLRQRQRSDGTWRLWWEPNAAARNLGFAAVELDAARLTWSAREAERINAEVAAKRDGQDITPRGGRTIAALIKLYRSDDEFTSKAAATRASYTANLRLIEDKWGPVAVASFTKPVIRTWYKTNRSERGETQAVRLNAMLSILFGYAELIGWRPEDTNPCHRIKMSQPKPRHRVATWAELDAILAAAQRTGLPSVGTAALLSALQGQRQGDVLGLTRGDIKRVTTTASDGTRLRAWAWQVDRAKNGTLGMVELHELVAERLAPDLDALPETAHIVTDERTGKPYTTLTFQDRWKTVRRAAATRCPSIADPVLQFRDLRRTFGVWSRAAGSSREDVGNVLGNTAHIDPHLERVYMPAQLDTSSRAIRAIRRPTQED